MYHHWFGKKFTLLITWVPLPVLNCRVFALNENLNISPGMLMIDCTPLTAGTRTSRCNEQGAVIATPDPSTMEAQLTEGPPATALVSPASARTKSFAEAVKKSWAVPGYRFWR